MKIFSLFGEILIEDERARQSLSSIDEKGEKAGGRLSKVAEIAGGLVISLAAVGAAALLALGVNAVNAADDFNKAMNTLQAQTGASNEQMAEFEDIATRIYNNNFGESFEDIAKSMSDVRKTTGLAGAELEKATTNALMLRDTFEFEVNESTRTANTLMKQFGITSDQAFTLIAQGAQNGADKNGDLLDTLNEYSPQFKALGFSADQFTNILIDGAQNGAWSIDKVGDAIKEFTIRSKDLSKTSLDAFQTLGLNGEQMSAAFAKGGESAQQAFQTVIREIGGLEDPLTRNAVGVALFGTQFEDLEADAILAFGNIGITANSTADTLAKINEVKYDSFGEALQGIGRNIETGVLIPLGQKLLPVMNEFANWVASKLPEVQAFFDRFFSGSGEGIGKLGQAWDWLMNEIIKPYLDFVVPFIQEKLDLISQYWADNGDNIMKTVETAFNLIRDIVSAVMPFIEDVIRITWDNIGTTISAVINIVSGVIKVLDGLLRGDFKQVWEGAKQIVSGAWDGIVGIVKGSVNLIIAAMNSMIRGLNKIKFNIPDWVPGMGGKSFGINLPSIPMLAKGTAYFEGGLAIVGEQGPELVNLPRGSKVHPANETDRMLDQEQEPPIIHTTINIDGRKAAESISRPQNERTTRRTRGIGVIPAT